MPLSLKKFKVTSSLKLENEKCDLFTEVDDIDSKCLTYNWLIIMCILVPSESATERH